MTLNCDLPIEVASDEFAKEANDETAKDLLDSAVEYWKCDQLSDRLLAIELRKVCSYLERTTDSQASGVLAPWQNIDTILDVLEKAGCCRNNYVNAPEDVVANALRDWLRSVYATKHKDAE